jgi:hypothetical protein
MGSRRNLRQKKAALLTRPSFLALLMLNSKQELLQKKQEPLNLVKGLRA